MFVGGFGHPPNSDGIKWFVNEVWPLVAGTAATTMLSIVGFDPPADVLSLASNTIRVLGHIDSAELKRLYRTSRLAIAPLRFGGGMKGKVLEAFAMGTPIVTTPVGMQGLQAARSFVAVSDKPRAFARHITHIYSDPAKLHKMAAAGIAFMQREFSNQVMLSRLRRDIPGL
jgi:glycosyltransferase involved in cell wall biosynthesis